jgi:hypothetical protein
MSDELITSMIIIIRTPEQEGERGMGKRGRGRGEYPIFITVVMGFLVRYSPEVKAKSNNCCSLFLPQISLVD